MRNKQKSANAKVDFSILDDNEPNSSSIEDVRSKKSNGSKKCTGRAAWYLYESIDRSRLGPTLSEPKRKIEQVDDESVA